MWYQTSSVQRCHRHAERSFFSDTFYLRILTSPIAAVAAASVDTMFPLVSTHPHPSLAELAGSDSDLNSLVALVSRGDPSIATLNVQSMELNGVTTTYGSSAAGAGTNESSGSGLSTGAIIGIAVGAVAALTAIVAGVFIIRCEARGAFSWAREAYG